MRNLQDLKCLFRTGLAIDQTNQPPGYLAIETGGQSIFSVACGLQTILPLKMLAIVAGEMSNNLLSRPDLDIGQESLHQNMVQK